jgi:hypothetical protein
VTSLMQTHLWRVRAAGGQLSEMSRQVEATREVWELYLDGVRNRTVRLNLQATGKGLSQSPHTASAIGPITLAVYPTHHDRLTLSALLYQSRRWR